MSSLTVAAGGTGVSSLTGNYWLTASVDGKTAVATAPGGSANRIQSDGTNWVSKGPFAQRVVVTVTGATAINAIGTTYGTGLTVIPAQGAGTAISINMIAMVATGNTRLTNNNTIIVNTKGVSGSIAGSNLAVTTSYPGYAVTAFTTAGDSNTDGTNVDARIYWGATQAGGDATTKLTFTIDYYVFGP